MKLINKTGDENIAVVYIAELDNGRLIEFVESVQPPLPRQKKWVLIISTLYGCPVKCRFCDAGGYYQGKVSKKEMISQIDYLILKRFRNRKVPVEKFKIQFARMGEPAFNQHLIALLEELPGLYDAPGLMPAISTIAPKGCDDFFEALMDIKQRIYKENFQLQFSIHTTDKNLRDWLIPAEKWNLEEIAGYGAKFFREGERKITLNFTLAEGMPLIADALLEYFNPQKFLIKITPVNPTCQAVQNKISSYISSDKKHYAVINALRKAGYEVILSIGELAENHIGSNCGQYITAFLHNKESIKDGYTYPLRKV